MSAQKRDFYEILGVDRSADADTIKKAYRKLAMQFHPDRNPGDKSAEDKFKEAAEAYDILSSQEKKSRYDQYGHQAFQGGGGGGFGGGFSDVNDIFSNFGDIFGDIFGGGGGFSQSRGSARTRNSPRKGADLRYICEIKLQDVLKDFEKQVEFDTDMECKDCTGTGAEKGSSPVTCRACNGRGQVVRQQGFFTMATTCTTCQGSGETVDKVCKPCRGEGRTKTKRKIKVNIPAGVDSGTRLRIANEGEGGYKGGPNGDLFVEVRVEDHDVFAREADNLFAELDVPYLQFILGGQVKVDALDGEVEVDVPRGAQIADRVKVSGRGIPSLRGSRRGDLFFSLRPEFPTKLSHDEEKLLREIAEVSKVNILEEKKGLFGRKK